MPAFDTCFSSVQQHFRPLPACIHKAAQARYRQTDGQEHSVSHTDKDRQTDRQTGRQADGHGHTDLIKVWRNGGCIDQALDSSRSASEEEQR